MGISRGTEELSRIAWWNNMNPSPSFWLQIFQPPPNFFPRIFLPFLKKITNPYSYPSDCFLTFGLSQDSNRFCTLRLIWYVILSLLIYEFTCFSLCHVFVNKSRLFVIWNCPHAELKKIILFTYFWLCGLDLLAVQGTLKSLLQHHNSKASILLCSAFFMVQLSHPNMTTGKTIALTRQTFVGKVMSLLFLVLWNPVFKKWPISGLGYDIWT